MLLGLDTAQSIAKLYLFSAGGECIAQKEWSADREMAHGLLLQLHTFLLEHAANFDELAGLFVFRGPGSFTGLRIGLTVMNSLAYARGIPIVGATGSEWIEDALSKLRSGESDGFVLPLYGAPARVTQPKK